MIRKMKKKMKNRLRELFYLSKSIFCLITTKKMENKIILTTTQGSYTCNPKAICEELLNSNIDCKIVWAVFKRNVLTEELKNQYPKRIKIVKKGSIEFYKDFYSSKIIVDNEHNFGRRWFCFKQKNQFLIQTWHGSLGLKRIAIDNSKSAHKIIKKNLRYQRLVDVCISNSDFETNSVFRTSYWKNNKILEFGHARNDIFFLNEDDKRIADLNKKIRKLYNIKKDEKIFLYAPTFRESDKLSIQEDINYDEIKNALSEKFGGKWVVIVRFHEKERNKHPEYCTEKNVIDATFYPDMQELLVVSDIGLTDYSSWICDFVLTRRPAFIYAPDLDEYDSSERGFYYPLSKTPFPISKNVDELINNIKNFEAKKYKKDCEEYFKYLGCIEDGNASKRIVQLIKEHL